MSRSVERAGSVMKTFIIMHSADTNIPVLSPPVHRQPCTEKCGRKVWRMAFDTALRVGPCMKPRLSTGHGQFAMTTICATRGYGALSPLWVAIHHCSTSGGHWGVFLYRLGCVYPAPARYDEGNGNLDMSFTSASYPPAFQELMQHTPKL
jgi:hypothetical protein